MAGKSCIAFEMDDAKEAYKHMDREIVKNYGGVFEGHFLHTWDDGQRILYRCRKCGGYILGQFSEFHGSEDDAYYADFFPVSGTEEAEIINRLFDGETIEKRFSRRWMIADGTPQWREGYVEKQTILTEIQHALVNGMLPADFSLPGIEREKLKPTSGILNAVNLFRMKHNVLSETDRDLIRRFLNALAAEEHLNAIRLFTQMCGQLKGYAAFTEIHAEVSKRKGELDERLLASFAEAEMTNAGLHEAEAIKVSLAILTISSPIESCRQIVRTLALYDEFTWYAIQVMKGWDNGENEILTLKQKVSHNIRKC